MKIVVLDIGGTSIKSGIFEDGELTQLKEHPTDAHLGGAFVMEKAVEIIHTYEGFQRIGISTAGLVNAEEGTIAYANSNIPNYTGTKVKEILEQEFGVPVAVENDVNSAAMGEATWGAGKGYNDFLCLTYGTGVGGAIVINKKIYRGMNHGAGEFGAMVLKSKERNVEQDLYSGCYEKYASTTGLVKSAKEFDPSLCNGREIFKRQGEVEVQGLIDAWVDEIVMGLVTLVHIFNPPCIVLGGGVMAQESIIDKIRKKLYNNIIPLYGDVKVVQAELGNTAGLLGAAKNALDITENQEKS